MTDKASKSILVAAIVLMIVIYSKGNAGQSAAETQQNKRPPIAVQFENDPQIPVVITEARVEVGEPFDMMARFSSFPGHLPASPPASPRMARMLSFTLKVKNQGVRPVTGLKLAIHSPLFSGSAASGTQGKQSSLEESEEVVVTSGMSADDRGDFFELVPNIRFTPLEVLYEPDNTFQWFRGGMAKDLKSEMWMFVIQFHELKNRTAKDDDGTNRVILIGSNPSQLNLAADKFSDLNESVYEMSADLKPTILSKEKAEYTAEARANKVQGKVVLNVIFCADGSIRVLGVISGLPHGLTGQAIKAAQKIRFEPAVKDGKPIDVRGDLKFSFDLDK
jgi:TonB family protein